MLGNPPWERIKLQEEEFFANRSALVATAKNKAERSQRIEWLREGVLLHNLNPYMERAEGLTPPNSVEIALYDAFLAARRGAEAASLFAHNGRRYPLTGVGDVNTYALFAETFLQTTLQTGRAGFIVPSGLGTDDSTKQFFAAVVSGKRLVSFFGFDNARRIFPAVHPDTPFSLVTLGQTNIPTKLVHYALSIEDIYDSRKQFTLSPSEFALINPNTLTCPVFRSERDAELTKKLYRVAPVLMLQEQGSDDCEQRAAENPWGIRFQAMLHMSSDSGIFLAQPNGNTANSDKIRCLPLYEAKMVHQFDHRWASYVDAPNKPDGLETIDVSAKQKNDPTYAVRPRYWVPEQEVLARIARVPVRIARAWQTWHAALATTIEQDKALADLLLALAAWVASELFLRTAGVPECNSTNTKLTWSPKALLSHISTIEQEMSARFGPLAKALQGSGMTTKKALLEFPKWAQQNLDVRLQDAELDALANNLALPSIKKPLLELLDEWMEHRSPQWLMGWRDITNATNERTVIASVISRVGVGNSLPLMLFPLGGERGKLAALLGNLSAMVFDFVARHKVGGTHLNYFIYKQLPVLPPKRYSDQALSFIVPRVLELTYTTHDLQPWYEELAFYDPRPLAEQGQPFAWNPERRAQLRAELDAYYAHLYELTREELQYILDPADVMGANYPSETFRVLKNNDLKQFNRYRTRDLVLEAWDRLQSGAAPMSQTVSATPPLFSAQSTIRNEEESRFAGLVIAIVEQCPQGISVPDMQALIAGAVSAGHYLEDADRAQFTEHASALQLEHAAIQLLDRIRPIVQRLEAVNGLTRQYHEGISLFRRGTAALPSDVFQLPAHADVAQLLIKANSARSAAELDLLDQVPAPIDIKSGTQ